MRDVAARRAPEDKRTFALGNINPGSVRFEFMQSILGLMKDPTSDEHGTQFVELISKVHGPYLDVGRNFVVERFLKSDAEVLLFVDSDMEFTPEQAHRVVASVSEEQPIIGGLYTNWFAEHGVRPVALNWNLDAEVAQMHPIDMPAEGDGLVEVGCVGTGFMAIHRSVLDKMTETFNPPCPWFAEVALGGSQMGEDVTFCQRAIALGSPVCVDTDLRIAHYKTVRFDPAEHMKKETISV